MFDALRQTYYRLLDELEIDTFRYLYHSFSLDSRLTGLVGPRGVGKTTLLLQFIKHRISNPRDAFYFSADHIYFNQTTLWDFISYLYEEEGIKLFFVDEVHKYNNWNQELKNIYDAFPDIKLVFSGSSSIELVSGSYDLSRRASMYHMKGFSFREYLNFTTETNFHTVGFSEIIQDPSGVAENFSRIPMLKRHFREYLRRGYYPFVLESGDHFSPRMEAVINETIHEDIANYYNLKTANLHYFKKLLSFLATIPPGKTSINNLAGNLGIDSKTTLHYVHILHSTGLARILNTNQRGAKLLRAPEKVFLANTTLLQTMCNALGQAVDIGAQRELALVSALTDAGKTVYCSKKLGDFTVDDVTFEVGGKNKTRRQLRGADQPAFLVKDDVLTGGKKTIPLYLFGFLY